MDFQESSPPLSSLWGATNPNPPGPELQSIADNHTNGHLNQAQRILLDSLEPTDEENLGTKRVNGKVGRGSGKPLHHSMYRKPTPAQKARWEAVQKALKQGLSLRAIARKLGMARMTVKNTPEQRALPPDASAPKNLPRLRL